MDFNRAAMLLHIVDSAVPSLRPNLRGIHDLAMAELLNLNAEASKELTANQKPAPVVLKPAVDKNVTLAGDEATRRSALAQESLDTIAKSNPGQLAETERRI